MHWSCVQLTALAVAALALTGCAPKEPEFVYKSPEATDTPAPKTSSEPKVPATVGDTTPTPDPATPGQSIADPATGAIATSNFDLAEIGLKPYPNGTVVEGSMQKVIQPEDLSYSYEFLTGDTPRQIVDFFKPMILEPGMELATETGGGVGGLMAGEAYITVTIVTEGGARKANVNVVKPK